MAMKLAHSTVTSDNNMATDKKHKQLAHVPDPSRNCFFNLMGKHEISE